MNVRLTYARFEAGEKQDRETGQTAVLSCDDPDPKKVVVCLEVSGNGWGFGTFTIVQTADGVFVDTECSPREMVKEAFAALVDMAIDERDQDPTRHQLYSRVMGRGCNSRCTACPPVDRPETPVNEERSEEK